MSRVLPEEPTILKLVKKLSRIFWSLKFHYPIHKRLSLSRPRSTKWSLDLSIPTKTLYTSLLSPIRATCPAHLILLDLITQIIFDDDYGP